MPGTKPQACPKCGAPATVRTYFVGCSSSDCTFSHIFFSLSDWQCLRYVSEEEAAPKVRRMKGNCNWTMCKHNGEHDYCGASCHEHQCKPVEAEQPVTPCAKYNVNCTIADNCNGSDETCGQYRRRVEPQAQGSVDYQLDYDDYSLLGFYDPTGEWWAHYQAPSLRGFMGFVYADGIVSPQPVRQDWGAIPVELRFPVAVRFSKETK